MVHETLPASLPNIAPPPVSFGFNSAATSPKLPDFRGISNNSSSVNLHSLFNEQQDISLSLTAKDLTLQESKTYMRWYLDILARTNLRPISISDVYQFLSNFKISPSTKESINRIFFKIQLLVNIGEFFALLRVISHALQGQSPSRELIRVKTEVPAPPSILWKKRQKEENDSEDDQFTRQSAINKGPNNPLDIDLFTQFMLTGERPGEETLKKRLKKLKTVKFSDEVETNYRDDAFASPSPAQQSNSIDYSLPMDQLMSRMHASRVTSSSSLELPEDHSRMVSSPDPEEKQILRDMESQIRHFQNLHSVDTILVDGVPSNIHLQANSDFSLPRNMLPQPTLLKPNMTGPAQMAQMGFYNGVRLGDAEYKYDPTLEGAQRMARMFSPSQGEVPRISLESFTSQMTDDQRLERPTVSRMRSFSQPSPSHLPSQWEGPNQVLPPSVTVNGTEQSGFRSATLSPASSGPPVPPRTSPGVIGRPAPPPPRSRKTSNSFSSPYVPGHDHGLPSFPEKMPSDNFYQSSDNSSTANMLDDLKALQEEVDKIRDLTGGF